MVAGISRKEESGVRGEDEEQSSEDPQGSGGEESARGGQAQGRGAEGGRGGRKASLRRHHSEEDPRLLQCLNASRRSV